VDRRFDALTPPAPEPKSGSSGISRDQQALKADAAVHDDHSWSRAAYFVLQFERALARNALPVTTCHHLLKAGGDRNSRLISTLSPLSPPFSNMPRGEGKVGGDALHAFSWERCWSALQVVTVVTKDLIE
jgi:hypothetical protein